MYDGIMDQVADKAGARAKSDALQTFAARDEQLALEAAARIEAENLGVVSGLEEQGELLDVPALAQELSDVVVMHPRFEGARADCTAFSWMPETQSTASWAAAKKAIGWPLETRGLRGWSITWPGHELPGALVLLYQQGTETNLDPPRVSVVPADTVLAEGAVREPDVTVDVMLAEGRKAERLARLDDLLGRVGNVVPGHYDIYWGNIYPPSDGDKMRQGIRDEVLSMAAAVGEETGKSALDVVEDYTLEIHNTLELFSSEEITGDVWSDLRLQKLLLARDYTAIDDDVRAAPVGYANERKRLYVWTPETGSETNITDPEYYHAQHLLREVRRLEKVKSIHEADSWHLPGLVNINGEGAKRELFHDGVYQSGAEHLAEIQEALMPPTTIEVPRTRFMGLLKDTVEIPKPGGVIGNQASLALFLNDAEVSTLRDTIAAGLEKIYQSSL